jgi:hypothetical protein
MANLKGAAVPPNPLTPDVRKDPRAEYLEALARTRKSLEGLLDVTDDPEQKALFGAMHFATMKLLSGIDTQTVAQMLSQSISPPPPPVPGGGLGMPPGPMAPPPPPPLAPAPFGAPMGMPGMPNVGPL